MSDIQITLKRKDIIVVLVGLLIGFVIGVVQPWIGAEDTVERTVDVTGVATISAEPDEDSYYVSYEALGETNQAATAAVTKIGDEVVNKLRELGVQDSALTNTISAHESYDCYFEDICSEGEEFTGTYSITVKLTDSDLSEKVFAHLQTTDAQGSISPYSSFSTAKTDELKQTARSQAVSNARSQAEQIANELGKKVGDVISVEEVSGFDYFYGLDAGIAFSESVDEATPILRGEQELSFTVKAVFEIK